MDTNTTHARAKEQFLRMYDAYCDAIFRLCLARCGSRDIAEDLTQDAFMKLWDCLRQGRTIANERAFLYAIARNRIIDWYRKKKPVSLDAMRQEGFEPRAEEGRRRIEEKADAAYAMKMLEALEPAHREVIVMRFVDDLSPSEIAGALHESANAVSVRINRAIKKLRSIAEEYEEKK